MKKSNFKNYAFEFLSILIAVITAFALNNWNDNRKDNLAESKILVEILNGLKKDKLDVAGNIGGHELGIKSVKFWRKIVRDESPNVDSLLIHYFRFTRDFISIQTTSGYEALKSRGFELIKNDSLREDIISVYEFDYQILEKLEEEYFEMQFQENYFKEINRVIAPNFIYNEKGDMVDMKLPLRLSASDRNIMLSYLWKIQNNREFMLGIYRDVEIKIQGLIKEIERELE